MNAEPELTVHRSESGFIKTLVYRMGFPGETMWIGYATVQVVAGQHNTLASLNGIDVRPNWRNLGLGTQMLEAICADLDELGVECWLQVAPSGGLHPDADDLTAWYSAHGWVAHEDDPHTMIRPAQTS